MATRKPKTSSRAANKAATAVAPKAAKPAPAKPSPDAGVAAAKQKEKQKQKQKLVRDSFTIPKNEYVVLDELKQRAIEAGRAVKKSEILRAGIGVLKQMADAAFIAALKTVPSLKTGRPKDAKKKPSKATAKKK